MPARSVVIAQPVEERAVLAGGKVCQWDDRLLGLEMTVLSRSPQLVTV